METMVTKLKSIFPKAKRKIAISLAVVIAVMMVLPYVSNTITAKGDVWFGDIPIPDATVAQWDVIAKMVNKNAERTDMQIYNRDIKGVSFGNLCGQTGGSKSGKWKDYQWKSTYCVSHNTATMVGNFESYPIWYAFGNYTIQALPDFIVKKAKDDVERQKFNFLMLAYATNYDNYLGGPISDPYYKTGNFYTMQLITSLCEEAQYTGDYQTDYDMTHKSVFDFADLVFHPNQLGSSQVYDDMTGNFDIKFNEIWNTAKLLTKCSESTDEGYIYKAEKITGDDGMTHVQMTYSEILHDILMSSKITTFGDWTYEFTPQYIDFKSSTGDMPSEGKISEIDSVGAANTIGKHIGTESVLSIRSPVKLDSNGKFTFMRTQENMVTCLKDGLKIIISDGPSTTIPDGDYDVLRYKHSESWETNYTVNLKKLDSETGMPVQGAEFDILEAFDDSQLDDTVLEDDNWENDRGSQFQKWNGWDSPEDTSGVEPCPKDQEITDKDGWLTGMTSVGGGELYSDGIRAHNDKKDYNYTKGFCGGHPVPEFVEIPEPEEEEDEETGKTEVTNQDEIDAAIALNDLLLNRYMSEIQKCFDLEAEGGHFCKADESGVSVNIQDAYGYKAKDEYESDCNENIPIPGAVDELEADRDQHYVDVISLTYDYSARETKAGKGYIIHNQDKIHGVFENIDDTVHTDTIPIETVTVHSSEYYDYLDNGIKHDSGGSGSFDGSRGPGDDDAYAFVPKVISASTEDSIEKATKTITATASSEMVSNDFVFEDSEENLDNKSEETEQTDTATASDAGQNLSASIIRSTFAISRGLDNDDDSSSGGSKPVRNSTKWEPSSIANNVVPGDSSYRDQGGSDWVFIVYDHRTEGEVHFNKRDLDLDKNKSDQFDTYGTAQGDGTLEGAVYGLFAAADIIHSDGNTGVVFKKDNLVSIAATDRNGDASFMAVTEPPGNIFNEKTGAVEQTSFTGPVNLYIEEKEQHSSNEDNWNNSRWYYPIENNESNNGNCWIGRPLFLGDYYIKELTRSEGYELSVHGLNAEISNRSAYENGGETLINGSVSVTKERMEIRAEDDGTSDRVFEINLKSQETTNGYDVSIHGVNPDLNPEFFITQKGTKEVYQEWVEYETVYEPMPAIPGNQVIISGSSVEAIIGDKITLPNGTVMEVKDAVTIESTPSKIKRIGNSYSIPNISTKLVPNLNHINADDFVNECNKAFAKIAPYDIGKEAPYVLVELGDDKNLWPKKMYDYLNSDVSVPFTTARIEQVTAISGHTYAVLRYSFVLNSNVQETVFAVKENAFYQKYEIGYSDGTDGYFYKRYPLNGIASGDYGVTGSTFNWVMLPNEITENKNILLYNNINDITFISSQKFKSLWVYSAGEFLLDTNGTIYQKPIQKEVKKSGYVTVDSYQDAAIQPILQNDKAYTIHINQTQIPENGELTITIKYNIQNPNYEINTTAFPSVDRSTTYIKMITLAYPTDQKKVYSDKDTRNAPEGVLERPIRQRIKVVKDIQTNPDGSYADDTYSAVHKENLSADGHNRWYTKATDWLTSLLLGNFGKETSNKIDNFRFKAYLKSNLERLYRDYDGNIVWLDRNGNTLVPQYQDTNGNGNYDTFTWTRTAQDGSGDSVIDFPEKQSVDKNSLQSSNVQKIYTKAEHNVNSTTIGDNSNNIWAAYGSPQTGAAENVGQLIGYTTSNNGTNGEAVKTSASLFSYNGKNNNVKKTNKINEGQNTGYTRLLEMTTDSQGSQAYDYEKFFDAIETADTDKWDNDMFSSKKNYPGRHWFETFYQKYQMDDADPDFTFENTDGIDSDNTAGGDKNTSFKPFQWTRENTFKENGEEHDYYNGKANNASFENKINTSDAARENAEASDAVRQFAIDYYLKAEVGKLVQNNGRDEDEAIPIERKTEDGRTVYEMPAYSDEVYDRALHNALVKTVSYLKPFYDNDLDTIYSVEWDTEANGGADSDYTTLNAADTESGKSYSYAISSYLPYGTYILVEQQPKRIDRAINDFTNKNYKTDLPKEVILPSLYEADKPGGTFQNYSRNYFYDAAKTPEQLAKNYHIRFYEEWADSHTDDLRTYVIRAHSNDGDYEIYKYGLDVDKLIGKITYPGGSYDYNGFHITQELYDPIKDYYNNPLVDKAVNGGNSSSHYPSDDKDYPHHDSGNKQYTPDEIEKRYHYASVSENSGFIDGIKTMTGNQTACEGRYASMLVPWTVVTPVDLKSCKAEDFAGYADMGFHNVFYKVNLRIEKLDSETGENILYDSAIFALYAASRYTTQAEVDAAIAEGAPATTKIGGAKFYLKDTTITGTSEFLDAMRADSIKPLKKDDDWDGMTKCSGIVPAGTPVCIETEQIALFDDMGAKTGEMTVFTTENDVNMVDEEASNTKSYQDQNTGYFISPQPVGAGVYVLAELKPPTGYVRTRPIAIEIYSDSVTYYMNGDWNSKVKAEIFRNES